MHWGAEVLRFQLNRIRIPAQIEQSIVASGKPVTRQPLRPRCRPTGPSRKKPAPRKAYSEHHGATLRLVPVLGRGTAASLREAIRQRLGYLTADGVEIDGDLRDPAGL